MNDRLFFDANILLDHLLARPGFAESATTLWSMVERRRVSGHVAAISFNFVYYVMRKTSNDRTARYGVKVVRDIFDVIAVDAQIINQAIDAPFSDFEDAIQHACAIRANADHIITRDLTGFRRSDVPVLTPDAYLAAHTDI